MLKSFRFNPGFQTDDQAVASFIVRQAELHFILEALSDMASPGRHRILVVAPRGAGKTTLCRRVLAELRRGLFLHAQWEPIFLGEESYSVTTPGEFLLECLYHLANDPVSPRAEADYARALEFDDEGELRSFCLAVLKSLVTASGKLFLVIVENLHMILRDQLVHDGRELIDILSDASIFGVLATSVQSDDSDVDDADLLGGFMQVALKPLGLDECHALWAALTGHNVERSRIRPLQILTGGSPRLIHILAEFMNTPSLQDLMDNLNFLIDQNTEYFKGQLDALPSQERKVFAALLEAWDPSSAKQISEAARVSVNTASSLLNRLSERGAVIKRPGNGRTVLYHAAERLFNIYYLMRRRSHPSNRVRALVAFMTQYYDREELVDTTARLALEACGVDPEGRADYHSAFDAILKGQPEAIRSEILKRTPPDFLESLRRDRDRIRHRLSPQEVQPDDTPEAVGDSFEEVLRDARSAVERQDYDIGQNLLMKAVSIRPENYRPWISLTFLKMQIDEAEGALDAAEEAVRRAGDSPLAYTVLGLAHGFADDDEAAAKAFSHALELDPEIQLALVELARIRDASGDRNGAIDLFERAAAIGPLDDHEAAHFGHLLASDDQLEAAEAVLTKAVAEDASNHVARTVLVQQYLEQGRQDDAVALLRQTAERSEEWEPWGHLASFLLHALDDAPAAVAALERAFARGVRAPHLFLLFALASQKTGAPVEAISAIADSLTAEIQADAMSLTVLGQIYQLGDQKDRAEEAYRAAAARDDADGYPWIMLGRLLLTQPARLDEAEDALRRSVVAEGEDGNCGPLKELAELRIHRGDDIEAVTLLDEALHRNDSCECSLVLRGDVAARNGDRAMARQLLEKAIALNPTSVPALTTLARISEEEVAESLIERAVEANPEDPRTLLARGRLQSRAADDRFEDLCGALDRDPNLAEAKLELALLKAGQGEAKLALDYLSSALDQLPSTMEIIPAFVESALNLVRRGHGDEVAVVLAGERGLVVEPLVVALKLLRGEQPVVAKEILDVAQDILERHGAGLAQKEV